MRTFEQYIQWVRDSRPKINCIWEDIRSLAIQEGVVKRFKKLTKFDTLHHHILGRYGQVYGEKVAELLGEYRFIHPYRDNQFFFSGLTEGEGLELFLARGWRPMETDTKSINVCSPEGIGRIHSTTFYRRFKNKFVELQLFSMEGKCQLEYDINRNLFVSGRNVIKPEVEIDLNTAFFVHPYPPLKNVRKEESYAEEHVLEIMEGLIERKTPTFYTQKAFSWGVLNSPTK